MSERFISEKIKPIIDTVDTRCLAVGEPGLPQQFIWRGETVEVVKTLRVWRTTGPCRNGSGEMYVRRHWAEVQTAAHGTMKIYYDRQPRGGSKNMGWWLFSIEK